MKKRRYAFDFSLLGKKSDYDLSNELNIPRERITEIRNRKGIKPYKKPKDDSKKLDIIIDYLEKNIYLGLKDLYKKCGFNTIFGEMIYLSTLKTLINEFEIKINEKSILLMQGIANAPRKKGWK